MNGIDAKGLSGRLLDRLNREGSGKLGYARDFQQRQWQPRQALLSPAYTTRWACLPVVK